MSIRPKSDPNGRAREVTPRSVRILLAATLLLAAALRLIGLTDSPPGLHQDEAANAWNAWCLFRTDHDQVGATWPVFYFRALGENRTPLFIYFLVPFQAIGGMNVWTTRLPNAIGGIACVGLLYYIGARWFGRRTGLLAALLLAVSPWAVHQSRWGHEGGAVLLLTLAPLAAWLWAGVLGTTSDSAHEPALSPWRCLLAGLLTGVCCYGYPSVRIFLPVYLVTAVLVDPRSSLRLLRRSGWRSGVGLACGLSVTFGPLAFAHATDENISKRAQFSWTWETRDPIATRVWKMAARYPGHFGPDFLFLRGDLHPMTRIAIGGQLGWHTLPGLLLGAGVVVWRARGDAAARLLGAWIICYPAGDLLSEHRVGSETSMHSMRSMPGAGALALLSARGLVAAGTGFRRVGPRTLLAGASMGAVAVAAESGRFAYHLFADYPRQFALWRGFHTDLMKACAWVEPRLGEYDKVFCTISGFNQPYIVAAVGLNYDPARWRAEPRDVLQGAQWDRYLRFGAIHFLYPDAWNQTLAEMRQDRTTQRTLFLVRPGETTLKDPVHTIADPAGRPTLLLFDVKL